MTRTPGNSKGNAVLPANLGTPELEENPKVVRSTKGSRGNSGRKIRLRPANSFDLIRLIAYSQSDPRKAMAELVQNALDAEARHLTITRQRRRGEVVLSILDDGRGIFPTLERSDALERIATNIGHSFKRNLSPAERQKQMLLGKYGIGLLGFWCVGRELEIRTRIGASEAWALRLVRDEPAAEFRRLPQSRILQDGDTWTEVVIRGVHPGSIRQLSGRRLGEYLGSELRGQLLSRDVKLRMVDRLARGSALKDFLIVPQRFQGRQIDEIGQLEVPGFSGAVLELYIVEEEQRKQAGRVALTCGGTVVNEDLGNGEHYELNPSLWQSGRLEGIVEFPDLEVAPSTRREFVPGPAVDALFLALKGVEPALERIFASERAKRALEEEENVAREIRRIFRPLAQSLPQYDFFEIPGRLGQSLPKGEDGAEKLGAREDGAPVATPEENANTEVVDAGEDSEPPAEILPPGPLTRVRIVPRKSRLLPGATRSLSAHAVDENGHLIREGVEYRWSLTKGGCLEGKGATASFTAPEELGAIGVAVVAKQGDRNAEAEAEIEIVDKLKGENPDAGIPDPRRAFDPDGDWRSRVVSRRWEYNAAHPDYQAIADDTKARLRYLSHLFAKEMVLRNYGEPKDERLLERMVEVLTHIKRG